MGIVYYGSSFKKSVYNKGRYKNSSTCNSLSSRQPAPRALTRQNIQFLKSLGLRTVVGGK